MPTGTFGGFPFDPEVYGSFVDQEPVFTDSIIASGILASDTNMTTLLDNGGTVGTTRFYNPLDPDTDAPGPQRYHQQHPRRDLRRQAVLHPYGSHESLEGQPAGTRTDRC